MDTYFVVRDTNHPQEDLQRNWSAFLGGWAVGDFVGLVFKTEEDAQNAWDKFYDGEGEKVEFRYHPAYESFVPVHYEGLGAYLLKSETLEQAIEEAKQMGGDLACTDGSGNGSFCAENVVSFHEAKTGTWVFEIKY